jgi:hypothetical protein
VSQWGHSDVLRRSARPMRPQESSLSRSTSAVAGRAAKPRRLLSDGWSECWRSASWLLEGGNQNPVPRDGRVRKTSPLHGSLALTRS